MALDTIRSRVTAWIDRLAIARARHRRLGSRFNPEPTPEAILEARREPA